MEIKMSNREKTNRPNVTIVTLPIANEIGENFVRKSLRLLEPLCSRIFLITTNFHDKANEEIQVINIKYKTPDKIGPIWIRILRFMLMQLRISTNLIKVQRNVEIVLFHLGGEFNLLPVLFSKLMKKKTVVFYFGGRRTHDMRLNERSAWGRTFLPYIAQILHKMVFLLADQIAVESESVIEWAGLDRYGYKVSATAAFYVDTSLFIPTRKLKDRQELVGFIGLLLPAKGVVNFVDALPLILCQLPDVEFIIGGSGPLFSETKTRLEEEKLCNKVKLAGWLSSDGVADWLNQMKLFVLPSYEEGLPNILLEAMACGTPVLATPVGGIPDVIKDGKTGFILEDNSAESIARNVVRALSHPKLLEITKSARALIESKYSYAASVQRYKNFLSN